MNKEKSLSTMTAKELYARPEEKIEWIIKDFIAPGLYILGGSPKIGKSWLILQMAIAIVNSQKFLGRETNSCGALYLCLEDSARRVKARAKKLVETPPDNLIFSFSSSSVSEGFETQITTFLNENPFVKLIIIDTLQKVRSTPKNGNMYANDYSEMGALKNLADEYNVCILVVHHLRKASDSDPMNRLSGSTGLTGSADGMWVLVRESRSIGLATLYTTGRDVEDEEIQLEFDDCCWFLCENTVEKAINEDVLLQALLAFLKDVTEFDGTATNLVCKLKKYSDENFSPSMVTKHLKKNEQIFKSAGIDFTQSRTRDSRNMHLSLNENAYKVEYETTGKIIDIPEAEIRQINTLSA